METVFYFDKKIFGTFESEEDAIQSALEILGDIEAIEEVLNKHDANERLPIIAILLEHVSKELGMTVEHTYDVLHEVMEGVVLEMGEPE